MTAMLVNRLEDGSYEHVKGENSDPMATEQAALALVAYDRYLRNANSLYDM